MASQNHEPSIALVLSLAPAVPLGCPSLCLGNVKKNHEVNGKSLKEIYADVYERNKTRRWREKSLLNKMNREKAILPGNFFCI